ncbi:glycoside hydrolase family 61 protein-like protein [Clohesyomyces aquaticus]|uniref:AA9 family lytic polysaccharide monooxygenase n=1 Tax=Clohesyomyces aquaticus TaxID=1231657 RepID=A0A1Y1ZVI2_9PLEO|nr:glycoside hydrolase family 61 protein-like protein [Clohesyomyces aquaticus]
MISLLASLLGLLAHHTAAHGGAVNYTVDDIWYPGYDTYGPTSQATAPWLPQRPWISNNPIFETTNTSLSCNVPGTSIPAQSYIPILPGQSISAVYYSWVHTVGPMIVWLTPCGTSCSTLDPSTALWFKIAERGLLSGDILEGMWFQRDFVKWDGSPSLWTEKLPEGLKAGKYLVRHEIVSLHSANRPQFYAECANLEVGGTGDRVPGEEYLVGIPGVWSMDQPEINIDVYDPVVGNQTTYKIPGPPVWI